MTNPRPSGRLVAACAAALLPLLAACGDSSAPAVPAQVAVAGGDDQSVPVGQSAPVPLSVRVTSQGGGAVQGEEVVWRVTEGSAVVDPDTSSTDANGVATTTLRMRETAGAVRVTATVRDLPPATFTLQATAGAATAVVVVGGNDQTGTVGEPLPQPLQVEARDQFGNPVPGATIEVATSGGTLTPTSATTDAQGRATVTWTLPEAPGELTGTARIAGQPVTAQLRATATAANPAAIVKVGGDAQQAPPGTTLAQPLVVRVTDRFGNPVQGATVTFTTQQGGSFATPAPTTNAEGRAQTTWTLGSDESLVDQAATATVAGAGSVTFTAVARDPCAEASPLGIEETIQGELTTDDCQPFASSGDVTVVDIYSVQIPEAGTYEFSMTSSAFDTFLWLLGAEGELRAFNDGEGGNADARLFVVAPPGEFFLLANSLNPNQTDTGPYSVSAAAVSGPLSGCLGTFQAWIVGTVQTQQEITASDCTFSDSTRVDLFGLVVLGGETVTVTQASTSFGGILRLYRLNRSAGQFQVVAVDTAAAGEAATVQFTENTGEFFLLGFATQAPSDAGAYTGSATFTTAGGALRDGAPGETPALRFLSAGRVGRMGSLLERGLPARIAIPELRP